MRSHVVSRAVVVAVLLGGCSDDASPGSGEVELGTGEIRFEAIDGEPELPVVAGSQGGFHIWASVRVRGFADERLKMVLTTDVEGLEDGHLEMNANLRMTEPVVGEGGWRGFAGYPAQLGDARCADGRRVRLAVEVSDSRGRRGSDERYCRAVVAETNRAPDCGL